MPLETPHSEYTANMAQWTTLRDCIAGEEAVKTAGDAYLPKLSGQDDAEYSAYKARAMFYGATGRTLQGLLGAIFRKPPEFLGPDDLSTIVSNIDLAGTRGDDFARRVTEAVIGIGRFGVLLDLPNSQNGNVRPYFVAYEAESIINWRCRVIDSVTVLDQVILKEVQETASDDGFGSTAAVRYRVLELDENDTYRQRVFTRDIETADWDIEVIEPRIRGKSLKYIPFVFFNPFSLVPGVEKAPLIDLARVNLAHYRNSADLEHGLHWTALPTPWVSGLGEDHNGDLYIGSNTAWSLPQGGQAGMLEFTGQGISAIRSAMQDKEGLMAKLGARLLEDQKKAAETAESKHLQYSGENSILATIANTVSLGLTQLLRWAAEWLNLPAGDVTAQLNTDFFDAPIDPQSITALVTAWQQGAISHFTLLHNLKSGEVLPPGTTEEDEIDRIETEGPALGGMPDVGAIGNDVTPNDGRESTQAA